MEMKENQTIRPQVLMVWETWGLASWVLLAIFGLLGVTFREGFWQGLVAGALGCAFSWLPVGIQRFLERHNRHTFQADQHQVLGFTIVRSMFLLCLFRAGTSATITTANVGGIFVGLLTDVIVLVVIIVLALAGEMSGAGSD